MTSDLIEKAAAARERAIAPYSGFKVGAAIETGNGEVFTGCNIENVTHGLTVCAERVALWKALSEGARGFSRIAVVVDASTAAAPCGACRQLLWEYCGDIEVAMYSLRGDEKHFQLSQLLPEPFDRRSVK
jgi:cytidine deaminase